MKREHIKRNIIAIIKNSKKFYFQKRKFNRNFTFYFNLNIKKLYIEIKIKIFMHQNI